MTHAIETASDRMESVQGDETLGFVSAGERVRRLRQARVAPPTANSVDDEAPVPTAAESAAAERRWLAGSASPLRMASAQRGEEEPIEPARPSASITPAVMVTGRVRSRTRRSEARESARERLLEVITDNVGLTARELTDAAGVSFSMTHLVLADMVHGATIIRSNAKPARYALAGQEDLLAAAALGTRGKILEVIGNQLGVDARAIAQAAGLNYASVMQQLTELHYDGAVIRSAQMPYRYALPGDGAAEALKSKVAADPGSRPTMAAAILRALRDKPGQTIPELASALGFKTSSVVTCVCGLSKQLIRSGRRPYLYALPGDEEALGRALDAARDAALPGSSDPAAAPAAGDGNPLSQMSAPSVLPADPARPSADIGTHRLDLTRLVAGSALVQANPGGGKSWLLRRLVEQCAHLLPQYIVDPEGEFATLKEKFPHFVLVAAVGGDVLADPRTARDLAMCMRRARTSAILDLYDLSPSARLEFVAGFVHGLVDSPPETFTPALVHVDEAHVAAPQRAPGRTGPPPSLHALQNLTSLGRKRGLGTVMATQRLSKLNKDVAAVLQTKLFGRTTLDIDLARVAEEMGVTKRQAQGVLPKMPAGTFFGHGPALSPELVRVVVGPVLTTHGRGNAVHLVPPTALTADLVAELKEVATPPPPPAPVEAGEDGDGGKDEVGRKSKARKKGAKKAGRRSARRKKPSKLKAVRARRRKGVRKAARGRS